MKPRPIDAVVGEIDAIWDDFHFDEAYWDLVVENAAWADDGSRVEEFRQENGVYPRAMYDLFGYELENACDCESCSGDRCDLGGSTGIDPTAHYTTIPEGWGAFECWIDSCSNPVRRPTSDDLGLCRLHVHVLRATTNHNTTEEGAAQ